LSKDSSELLNKGKYPGPMTEINFWEAKCMNLESLYEQMKASTTKNMASILEHTDRFISSNFHIKLITPIKRLLPGLPLDAEERGSGFERGAGHHDVP